MDRLSTFLPADLLADPDRLGVLYGPFRDRSVNPIGYDAKLGTWTEAIQVYLQHSKIVHLDEKRLAEAFKLPDGRRPQCLEVVLSHLLATRRLQGESDFLSTLASSQRGWIAWGVGLGFNYLVKKPVTMTLNWAWTSLTGAESGQAKGPLISLDAVNQQSDALFELCTSKSFKQQLSSCREFSKSKTPVGVTTSAAKLLSSSYSSAPNITESEGIEWGCLAREVSQVTNDEKSLAILVGVLRAKGKANVTQQGSGSKATTVVTFISPITQEFNTPNSNICNDILTPVKMKASPKKVAQTEKDKTMALLESTAKDLVTQIEQFHELMTKLKEVAKEYLAKGIRPLALNALKRKKVLEHQVQDKEKALENIQIMISKLQDADSNKMVLDAYKDAVAALNRSQAELSADAVEDTMADIADALSRQREVDEALSTKVDEEEADDNELEEELEQILNDSQRENDSIPAELIFPQVPHNDSVDDVDVDKLLESLCISPLKHSATSRNPVAEMAS